MRNAQGYAQIVGPGLEELSDPGLLSLNKWGECDTFTCAHCLKITHVPAATDPTCIGALCRICDSLVCAECSNEQKCSPFEEKIEETILKQQAVGQWF